MCLVSAGSGCGGSWKWAPREYSEGFRQRQASLFGYEKERRLSVTWESKTDHLIWIQPDGLIPSFGILVLTSQCLNFLMRNF